MKKVLRSAVATLALTAGSVGVVATAATLGATTASASTMKVHSWHGTIEKVNAKMGKDGLFTLKDGMKIYKVHYTGMTRFTLGSRASIKAGGMVGVTGNLTGSTIAATKISL